MPADAQHYNPAVEPSADLDLVARLQAGDADAFEELVRAHGGTLLITARRFLRNEADAQDALQECFISIFRGISSFAFQSSLRTWMHRIVVNASLMKIRSRGRRPEWAIDDLLPEFTEDGHHTIEPRAWTPTSEELAMQSETRAAVRAAIDQLPDAYRTVLLLRDIEGFDTEETAKLLSSSVSAVKVRLHRARQALRSILEKQILQFEGGAR